MGTRERFEELTADALDGLPKWVHERMDNVEIVIEERPPADQPWLLGLYEGIPLTRRGNGYFGVVPGSITLFRSRSAARRERRPAKRDNRPHGGTRGRAHLGIWTTAAGDRRYVGLWLQS